MLKITKEQLELDYQSGMSMSEIGKKHTASAAVFRAMKKYANHGVLFTKRGTIKCHS